MELVFPNRRYINELGLISQGPSGTNSLRFGSKKTYCAQASLKPTESSCGHAFQQVLISRQTTGVIQRALRWLSSLVQALGKQGRGR